MDSLTHLTCCSKNVLYQKSGHTYAGRRVDLSAGVAGIRPMDTQQNRPTNDVDAD